MNPSSRPVSSFIHHPLARDLVSSCAPTLSEWTQTQSHPNTAETLRFRWRTVTVFLARTASPTPSCRDPGSGRATRTRSSSTGLSSTREVRMGHQERRRQGCGQVSMVANPHWSYRPLTYQGCLQCKRRRVRCVWTSPNLLALCSPTVRCDEKGHPTFDGNGVAGTCNACERLGLRCDWDIPGNERETFQRFRWSPRSRRGSTQAEASQGQVRGRGHLSGGTCYTVARPLSSDST
jgi:hypothetical protein